MPNPNITAVCPFYQHEAKYSIACEGLAASSTRTSVKFGNESSKNRWLREYCACFNYKSCPLARMIDKEKYGGTR